MRRSKKLTGLEILTLDDRTVEHASVAKRLRHRVVVPVFAGSIPVVRPQETVRRIATPLDFTKYRLCAGVSRRKGGA